MACVVARVITFFAQRGIGAAVTQQLGFECHQAAIAGGARFDADRRGVPFGMKTQRFGTVVEHFDRPAGGACQHGHVNLSGDVLFATKTTTDECAHHAYLVGRYAQAVSDLFTVGIGDLRADVYGQLVVQWAIASVAHGLEW